MKSNKEFNHYYRRTCQVCENRYATKGKFSARCPDCRSLRGRGGNNEYVLSNNKGKIRCLFWLIEEDKQCSRYACNKIYFCIQHQKVLKNKVYKDEVDYQNKRIEEVLKNGKRL